MTYRVEYHKDVKRLIAASVAVFGLLFFVAVLAPTTFAQINGAPASVTSPGFGGHVVNGTRASVTSLGPAGLAPNTPLRSHVAHRDHDGDRPHHYRYPYGGIYAVPVPYAADVTSDNNNPEDDAEYQGGPTIFDRRGAGPQSYIPPAKDAAAAHANDSVASDPPEQLEPPQELTMLVFKDGHQIEVGNYAIVGHMLYDMTPGHPRKVALADLDLSATEKQNDDRGVRFQLPPSAQAN